MGCEDWSVPIGADGAWLCEHADAEGRPAPPSRLRAADAVEERPGYMAENAAGLLRCPACGTYWRVSKRLGVAKCYAATPHTRPELIGLLRAPPPYRRARLRDIDRVIAAISATLPDVAVMQHQQYWPADDDNLWTFRLPGVSSDVQIESLDGACPFIVETDELSSYDARTVQTVEEVVAMIVEDFTRAVP